MRRLALSIALFLTLAVPGLAAAQARDSVAAVDRHEAALQRTRPSSREAWTGGALVAAGLAAGAVMGVSAGSLVPFGCTELYCVSHLLGIVVGSAGGAYAAGTVSRRYLTGHRGSIVGATVGTVVGIVAGATIPIDRNGVGNAIAMPVLAVAVGAFGYRYGPWAKGPKRRVAVSAMPVAVPDGAGMYVAVRF